MAAAVPLRADRSADPPPRLRAVPARRRRPRRRAWGDAVFATALAVVLGVGIVGVLLLNTAMQTQADQIQATRQKLAALLLVAQGEQTALDRMNTPGTLADRAVALHMRPAANMPVLRVPARTPTRLPAAPLSARAPAKSRVHGG